MFSSSSSILFTLTHNKEQIVDCSSFHVEEEDVLNQVSVSVIWNFRTVLAMKWGSSFKDYLSLFKWGKPINNTAKKSNIWPRFLTFTTDLDSEGKKGNTDGYLWKFLVSIDRVEPWWLIKAIITTIILKEPKWKKSIKVKGPELFQSTKTWIPRDNKTRNAQRNDDFIFMILLAHSMSTKASL